eukprot:TRINITY_DN2862_c1_g1_i1.p1 TRINITY_DN2862_c1_g1~~TRINITY_DN2862_c1_g1_i1.p1  ORF type:complete len:521 (+),score=123.39 TRINITY_DN2862_c1_g1_i1:105-1667(+)
MSGAAVITPHPPGGHRLVSGGAVRGALTPHDAASLRLVQTEMRRHVLASCELDEAGCRAECAAEETERRAVLSSALRICERSLVLAGRRSLVEADVAQEEYQWRLLICGRAKRSLRDAAEAENARLQRCATLRHEADMRRRRFALFSAAEQLQAEVAAAESSARRQLECSAVPLTRALLEHAAPRYEVAAEEWAGRARVLALSEESCRQCGSAVEQRLRSRMEQQLRCLHDSRLSDAVRARQSACCRLQRGWRCSRARRERAQRHFLTAALREHRVLWECDLLDMHVADRRTFVDGELFSRRLLIEAEAGERRVIETEELSVPFAKGVRQRAAAARAQRLQDTVLDEGAGRSGVAAAAVEGSAELLKLCAAPLHRRQRLHIEQYELFGREHVAAEYANWWRAALSESVDAGARRLGRAEECGRSEIGSAHTRSRAQLAILLAALVSEAEEKCVVMGRRREASASAVQLWWRRRPFRQRRLRDLKKALTHPAGPRARYTAATAAAARAAAERELRLLIEEP